MESTSGSDGTPDSGGHTPLQDEIKKLQDELKRAKEVVSQKDVAISELRSKGKDLLQKVYGCVRVLICSYRY